MDILHTVIDVIALLIMPFVGWIWRTKPDRDEMNSAISSAKEAAKKHIDDTLGTHEVMVDQKIAAAKAADKEVDDLRDKLFSAQIGGLNTSLLDIKTGLSIVTADVKELLRSK